MSFRWLIVAILFLVSCGSTPPVTDVPKPTEPFINRIANPNPILTVRDDTKLRLIDNNIASTTVMKGTRVFLVTRTVTTDNDGNWYYVQVVNGSVKGLINEQMLDYEESVQQASAPVAKPQSAPQNSLQPSTISPTAVPNLIAASKPQNAPSGSSAAEATAEAAVAANILRQSVERGAATRSASPPVVVSTLVVPNQGIKCSPLTKDNVDVCLNGTWLLATPSSIHCAQFPDGTRLEISDGVITIRTPHVENAPYRVSKQNILTILFSGVIPVDFDFQRTESTMTLRRSPQDQCQFRKTQ